MENGKLKVVLKIFNGLVRLPSFKEEGSSRVKRERATDTGGGLVSKLLLGFTQPTLFNLTSPTWKISKTTFHCPFSIFHLLLKL